MSDPLGDIRRLTEACKAGNDNSFRAMRDLFQTLLAATIMEPGESVVVRRGKKPNTGLLTGRQFVPVRVRDGRYLRITAALELDENRLKVREASYQYQQSSDEQNTGEIFRYDYARIQGPDAHPSAHLNLHGSLDVADVLPADRPLSRIHFPTARVSIEAVIRCLIEQFKVPTAPLDPQAGHSITWREVLTASEESFLTIAHQPLSGPPA